MSEQHDVLQVEGINARGYGIIPKMVMQDPRLSVSAKAIYSYFCTYAGAGRQAFPRVTRIIKDLGISQGAYYKHFGQLKEYGYIKAEQERKDGKLSHNIYTLMQTVTPYTKKPCTAFQHTELQDTEKQRTVNCGTNIINSPENYHSLKSNSQSSPLGTDGPDVAQQIEGYTETVRANIGYQDLQETHPHDHRLLDEIVGIVVDALVSDSSHVAVDGESKPRALVQHQLGLLDYEAVELVIDQFKAHTGRIKRKKQYLLTMLYNSTVELDAHYTNEVKSDASCPRSLN